MSVRRLLLLVGSGILLCALALGVYAAWVSASAKRLIESASEIHSTEDAQRQIAAWRNRSGRLFLETNSPTDGDHNYDIRVDNTYLHRLRIAPPAMVGMTISLRNNELRYLALVMYTGRNETAGVWLQEWFGSGRGNDFRVNAKDRPWKAKLDFSSAVPYTERQEAFALNSDCLIRPRGCRQAEEILPGVWKWNEQKD